ncbi:hypothetical protein HL033_00550 [Neoehrlichia mikurensis]|uniref:Sec-independent protein translocase protein TatB n=1 Tax=Neoehrlichia mikurensis TaxID=89586 RepID=A0A9Q9BZ95_9RICK|nr:hypothetical protein [Neoehrlichia mikurensis]QXK92061.1 hypothetical protein IAH97_00550 [Neoehrlichia mikurensis]QXK92518.1 hypothetical protein HUN61_00550 [Neoehrlichia mikurensis]QXK93754.1 hypothetical protein HL033_00550 [Neoehrlichia mikurensis]UTO55275.1 hypothetical protein LUA82_03730 [Neoehrlichia mikurensis]UTO56195.1 hypothetical protein LUA81_03695 [Neoehrlichia mikurensis]
MFSIGLSEIIVIIVVGCLMLDPKKLPHVIKDIQTLYKKIFIIRQELINTAKSINICDIDDNEEENVIKKKIIGNDGNVYEAYEIKNLINNKEAKSYDSKNTNS